MSKSFPPHTIFQWIFQGIFLTTILFGFSNAAFAATKTWQNGGVNNNWSTAGNWVEGSKPANGDDVVIAVNYAMTLDENTAELNSIDMTGYANAITNSGSVSILVWPTSGTQIAKFAGTITNNGGGGISLAPANGATLNVNFGTATLNTPVNVGNSGGTKTGTTYFLDALSIGSTRTLTLFVGTLHTDGADDAQGLTHSWGLFSSSNSNTRTLTLGNSTIGMTGTTGNVWLTDTATNLTVNKGTSTINFTGVGNYGMNWGGITVYDVNITIGNSNGVYFGYYTPSFHNLTISMGSTGRSTNFYSYANFIVTGAFTVTGNSAVNRLLFKAQTLGTPITITVSGATVSTNNVDFRDITFARTDAGGLDLTNGGANLIGDAGGNSRTGGDGTVTFTTPATQTVTGSSSNWSTATWSERVPLPQDNVVISLTAGQTLTADMPRLGKDISFTTATNLTLSNTVTSYGSLDFTNAGAIAGDFNWVFERQERTGTTSITSAGKAFPGWGGSGFKIDILQPSTLQIIGALAVNGSFQLTSGNFTDNGYSISATDFDLLSNGNPTVIKSGSWTATRVGSSNAFKIGTVNWSDTGGTIIISNTGTGQKTFTGNGKTFYNLTTPSGTGGVAITGANQFNNITVAAGGKLTLPASTITTVSSLTANGTNGNSITLLSSTPGTPATLSGSSGINILSYCSIKDITATGGASFKAYNNCTNVSGNTGWKFKRAPIIVR